MVFWFFKKSEDPPPNTAKQSAEDHRAKSPQDKSRKSENRKKSSKEKSRSKEKVEKSSRMAKNDAEVATDGTSPDIADDPSSPTTFVPVNVTVRPAVTKMHTRNVMKEEGEEPTQKDNVDTPPGAKSSDKKKNFFKKLTDRKKTSERKRNNPPNRDLTTNTTDDSSRVRKLEEEQEKLQKEVSALKTQIVELQVQFASVHAKLLEVQGLSERRSDLTQRFSPQISPTFQDTEKELPSPTPTTYPSKPSVVEKSVFTPNAVALPPQNKLLVVPTVTTNQIAPSPTLLATTPPIRSPTPPPKTLIQQPLTLGTPQIQVQNTVAGAPSVRYVIKDHRLLNGKLVPYYVPELLPKPANPTNAAGSSPKNQPKAGTPPANKGPTSPNPQGRV